MTQPGVSRIRSANSAIFLSLADILRIANAGVLPRAHDRFVDVNSRNANGPEEIALARFVHAEAREQQIGIQHFLVAELHLFENFRLKHELDELLRPLPLHDELAAFVENDVQLVLRAGETRVRHFAKLETVRLQMLAQRRRLRVGQFAGVDRQRFHFRERRVRGYARQQCGKKKSRIQSPKSNARRRHRNSRPTFYVSRLLSWFAANARDLPWRRTLDPYAVWVSEIMLQQTQVKTVIPYFERWMRELPTIESLASASSERIHKLWEGLGYYTRVRNMQKAAQVILEKHGGKFPREFDDVLALPGIGRYTAGAICSIAFNQPAPILDGNVIRVLTRVFGIRENAREKETNAWLWELARRLVTAANARDTSTLATTRNIPTPHHDPLPVEGRGRSARQRLVLLDSIPPSGPCSALNQSLMELGALVCTPRQPNCAACPVTRLCKARRAGLVDQLPNLGERVSATARRFTACVIERHGAVLVRQRPAGVVNGHLWEFPNVEVALKTSVAKARRHLETELGCALDSLTPLATVKHTITRYRITLEAFRGELTDAAAPPGAGQWISKSELERLPFTSAHRRVLVAARLDDEERL